MPSVNYVELIGHLGRDAELKYTQNNVAICSFSLATSDRWLDKASGEWQEKTEWHNVKVFGQAAERAGKLEKGNLVRVIGSIEYRKYKAKDGSEKMAVDIKASSVMSFERKPEAEKKFTPPAAPAGGPDEDGSELPF